MHLTAAATTFLVTSLFGLVVADGAGFLTFSSQGMDVFEDGLPPARRGRILQQCVSCHSEPNIRSLRIAQRLLKPHARLDYRHPRWSVWAEPAIQAKTRRADWGLLQALWR